MDIPIHEQERDRLNQRIHALAHRPVLLRALRRYRRDINKLPAIRQRGARAIPHHTAKGMRYRAADEVRLCHRFLDEHLASATCSS